jgi:hypothetical protein
MEGLGVAQSIDRALDLVWIEERAVSHAPTPGGIVRPAATTTLRSTLVDFLRKARGRR